MEERENHLYSFQQIFFSLWWVGRTVGRDGGDSLLRGESARAGLAGLPAEVTRHVDVALLDADDDARGGEDGGRVDGAAAVGPAVREAVDGPEDDADGGGCQAVRQEVRLAAADDDDAQRRLRGLERQHLGHAVSVVHVHREDERPRRDGRPRKRLGREQAANTRKLRAQRCGGP